MNLVKVINEFKLQKCGAFICKKCDANIPDIRKYKYIDVTEFWYDDENDPDHNAWAEVEGMGYGSIWCGNWLRCHSKFLQRRAVRKFAQRRMGLFLREDNLVLTYKFDGAECFGFMIGGWCYVQIRVSNKELDVQTGDTMFDSKLFYDLCKEYGVELSDKYSEPMIKVNGEIIPLKEYDFEKCKKIKEK